MISKKEWRDIQKLIILFSVFSILISLIIVSTYYTYKESNKGKFKISELEEGVGIQICPYSIDTTDLICNNKLSYKTAELTQDALNQILRNCENPVLITSKECLSEKLTIISKKKK